MPYASQCSDSTRPNRYRAFGNVGTHAPSTQRVFHPTWSWCRCVHTTVSIDSGGKPAATIASRNGSCMWWKNRTVRSLSLPTQVSIAIRRPCDSTTSSWIRRWIRPVVGREVGLEPRVGEHRVGRRPRQDQLDRDRRLDLDDARDAHVAHLPAVHAPLTVADLLDPGRFPVAPAPGHDLELDRLPDAHRAGAVGDLGRVERVLLPGRGHGAEPALLVERRDRARRHRQWTIFRIGSSMMPVAPASRSAGISVLISAFATTVSTANASSP